MQRRDFIKLTGVGAGGLMLPMSGFAVSADQLLDKPMDCLLYTSDAADE